MEITEFRLFFTSSYFHKLLGHSRVGQLLQPYSVQDWGLIKVGCFHSPVLERLTLYELVSYKALFCCRWAAVFSLKICWTV